MDEMDESIFIGSLLFVSTSIVLRGRKLFADTHFEESFFDDYPVHVLSEKTDLGRGTIHKINGARKTLERGWLQKFIIVVSRDESNPGSALEVFTWSFEYAGANMSAFFQSGDASDIVFIGSENMENSRRQAKALLVGLSDILEKQLTALPDGCFPGFRLVYNDERHPGYQPAGFSRTETLYNFEGRSRCFNKNVLAKYHRLSLDIQSTAFTDKDVYKKAIRAVKEAEDFEIARSGSFSNEDDIEDDEDTPLVNEISPRYAADESFMNTSCLATIDSSALTPRRRLTSPSSMDSSPIKKKRRTRSRAQ